MRFRRATIAGPVGALALAVAGFITISCGGVTDPSKNSTDTLTLNVTARGGVSNVGTFNIQNTGEYSVKATASNPVYSSTFALTVGVGDSSNCSTIQQNFFATVNGASIGGAVVQKGLYCVYINDVNGSFPTTGVSFTVQASHP
jgi:hypothetical protein